MAGAALCFFALGATPARADSALHTLWELHGKHNTVYLFGSIHALRASDYPLGPGGARRLSRLPSRCSWRSISTRSTRQICRPRCWRAPCCRTARVCRRSWDRQRYARAESLAHEVGVELSTFDQFAPWFAAEAISQVQLSQLGFQAAIRRRDVFPGACAQRRQERRRPRDGPRPDCAVREHVDGDASPISAVEPRAGARPAQAGRRHGAAPGSAATRLVRGRDQIRSRPRSRACINLSWWRATANGFRRIEALLNDDKNYLVIVGTAHLVGRDSVIDLLKTDGVVAAQR